MKKAHLTWGTVETVAQDSAQRQHVGALCSAKGVSRA